jgi:hypothetical protein
MSSTLTFLVGKLVFIRMWKSRKTTSFSYYNTSYINSFRAFDSKRNTRITICNYLLPNTCILELPVSATNTFPSGSIARSSGLLNCPSCFPLDPNLLMNLPFSSNT